SGARSSTARRAKLIDLDQLKEKTLQEIKELLDIKNPGSFDIQQLMKNLREAYLEIAKDALNNLLGKLFPGQFSSFDVCMNGVKIFGPNDIKFFSFTFNFFLGPVPMQFGFSAGGSWKVECGFKLCFLTMKAEGTATPQIGAMVSGELNVNLFLFKAGLKLTGYLLTTKFPTKAEVGFSKFPLDVGIRMDLELIPLRLELRAILKLTVKLLFIKIEKTLINKLLWHYTTPSITANIFDIHNKEPDNSPPTFNSFATTSGSGSGKRSSATSQCTVYQLRNRDYTEPAFQLAISVEDDRSEVEVSYSVGSFQGGSDLAKDEVLGGPSAVVEQVLPGRIPLYFTVKGTNSAGGTASVTCQLSSYDTTPPAGRVIPDFFTTSHPNVLKASAMAVDETPLVERKEAIGFGRGIYGDQAFPWSDISSRPLRSSTKSVETSLLQFTSPRLGKLMSKPHQVKLGHATPGKCASACLALPPLKCISFNYDYGTSGQCELLEEVEGHGVKIHIAGHFHYFERLGIGHAVTFNHRDLHLQHGQLYYFNYYLKNQLGYTNILTSQPVKVDFTPVSPGPIQNAHYDETVKEPCHELLPDKWENRCVDESNLPNHRYIIDGEGSATVFNGHTPFVDVLYTRANKYVSANWDGFHDYETGIYGYTWSVGTEKCLENIHPHKDPHAHLFDESEWTHTGLAHPLDLEDGLYYVSVRAINKVEYGGPLATTVCHSTPYAIDNTEPLIHEVFEMLYDEETHVILASYNVSDPLSNIKEMHIGLGKSTRDTYILDWFVHDDADSVEFTHHIPDGEPTWLRIRAVNNVDLRTAGHGPYPILVDTTPPLAGDVYDGRSHGRQVNFQSSQSEICANWENFWDPDTGIADYLWGVGTSPGDDDVVEFKRLRHFVFLHCDNSVNLTHNATYYSTLYAFNRGHKRLNVSANSEGVRVDLTPPEAGWLKDGDTIGQDLKYSSSPATVSGNWGGFTDPESGIQQYTIAVLRKPKHQVEDEVIHASESVGMTTSFRWHHFHLHQGDQVFVNLNVTNRALGVTTLQSDGFVLDLTPPVLKYLRDGLDPDKDAQYSSSTTELTANWKFVDEETGVDYIELQVYQKHGGTRSPLGESVTLDGAAQNWTSTEALSLNIGALYTVKVHAINAAGLTAVHETDGVLIDPTPPEILFIHAGVLSGMDDEELTNGFVVIANTGTLTASWLGLDGESGIDSYWIGLGTTHGGDDVLGFYSVGEVTDIILTELPLQLFENGSPIYYISVKAQNGAGAFSTTVTASPIKVVAADVSGLVFDGAGSSDLTQMASTAIDVDYQLEATTVSLQFEGYESAQHGIIGYEWGVGTIPGADDIQPFTDMGIVAFDEPAGSGIAQILLPLSSSNRYFSSVRAITGALNILESTSDGFGVDQSAPSVSIVSVGEDEDDSGNKPLGRDTVYQAINTGSLAAEWNIGDNESAIAAAWFAIGFTPISSDLYNITNTNKRTSLAAGLLIPSADGTPNMVTVTAMNNHEFDESGVLTSAYASLFDVHPFTNVERDTLVDLANMTLEHKGTYYVTVMASDESLQCDVVTAPFTVDITPPKKGRIQIGPFANLVIQCGNTAHNAPQLTEPVTLSANYSSYTFVDLFLEGTMVYFVQLNAVNRATGSTTVTSSPVLIDPRDPIPGDIVDGDSFKRDVSHQSSTSSLHGTFTLYHGQEAYQCSYNHHDLDAPTEAWSPVTSQGVWGTSIEASRIRFAPEQLSYSVSNGLTVTMVRDVRAERMISGGYMTVLNHEGPGIFQIDIVAAGSELDSVTSLVFWDGPAGVVGGFEMPSDPEESSNFSTSAPTTTPATTQNPWQIVNDNSEETSDENAVLRTLPYTGIGMDIFHEVTAEGTTKYYILLWSRFQDERSALQYEKIELGFDASEAWHTYGLKYTVDRTDATQELWGFELHIDGEYFTTITGIPPVSLSTKLILAVRSKQGAVAEFHDVFTPPTVMAHFKNLRTPPSAEMLCRYGTPFQDGSTTILKIYAGVGTTKGADDVEPFFEVEDLCTPCMDECSRYSCDMNCTVDDITLHHVFINNLHLSTHKMITQDNVTTSTPALYYITIKAVSGSGRFALSSSDGVYIDATPPVFESLYHVDLSWSEDEPSDFQGSNSTIAVRWEAYDIESQVVGYFWAIGTAPFWTDIQDHVSVGLATSASNSQLEGSLQPLQTYYATVIAVNGAGLNTTKSTTGVTFLEESPSSENMTIGVGCREDQNDGSSSEDDVSVCPGIKSSVEISWPDFDEREGITGYYFSIGSTEELEDIIPETQVGYNESGTVLIEDGQVLINGQVIANISDLRHMQNDDQSTPEVNKFNMEPGRKMYVKVKACNSAHKCSIIDLKVIVVSREGDVVAKATNSSKVSVTLNSSGATRSARTYVINGVNIVTTGITPGDGLVAGMLDKHDVEEEYVSGASSTFTPFIVDPERTRNNSERSLNGRLRKFEETFFISLLHDNPLTGPLEITIPINADLIPEGTVPVLLYWSTELQQWMDASRTCPNLDNVQYDWEQNLLHVNVCSTHPATKTSEENVRRRRSSEGEFYSGSTQFAEASVDSDIINTAPVVTSPSAMWMYEDSGTLRAQLQAQDAEGDELIFSLDAEPEEDIMGEAVLSPEGLLEYTPCRHCFGLVRIGYVVQEKPTGETTPLEVRETLTIDVRPENDNPGLLFLIDGVNVVSDQGTNTYRPVELPVKQGEENSMVVWMYDVDIADDLAFSISQPQHGGVQIGPVCKNVTFLSTPCSMSSTNNLDITSDGNCTVCKPSNLNTTKEIHDLSWALARLTYISRNESYFGEDSFAIHGIDENGGASKILPIDVFVLQKCKNNGTCIGPAEDPDCEDTQLAFGFEGYTCDCTEDYIGEFCQLEIVPCLPPMAPANGSVSPDDATSYQDVVEFSCDPGYELVGDSAHVCQWDGRWNSSTPNCNPVPCPTLSAPANGALSPSGPHVYQDVVTFTCSTGYVVTGVSTVTCQADGTWSRTVPTCNSEIIFTIVFA
ncbi:PREDICTED: uncharacterized protein LOC109462715, partial [Branchiostoma belcheri]|uniref:Uncharacterized protein LOC109462715 n=1 Tax=Branchiostoma belcheri TaxID=7741 RepID=A0A6P4Y7S5_BRABE